MRLKPVKAPRDIIEWTGIAIDKAPHLTRKLELVPQCGLFSKKSAINLALLQHLARDQRRNSA